MEKFSFTDVDKDRLFITLRRKLNNGRADSLCIRCSDAKDNESAAVILYDKDIIALRDFLMSI